MGQSRYRTFSSLQNIPLDSTALCTTILFLIKCQTFKKGKGIFFPLGLNTLYLVSFKQDLVLSLSLPHNFNLPTQAMRKFFFLKHLYWSIIAPQWCVSFCCITQWISYTYTHIFMSPPSCVSLPPSLPHPSRCSQSTELISLCYVAASHKLIFKAKITLSLHGLLYFLLLYSLSSIYKRH